MDNRRYIEAIGSVVPMLCEAYNRTSTEATCFAYELGLAGLTVEQVHRAAAIALQRSRFMPTPAELRDLALGDAGVEATAAMAFARLGEAVKRLGPDYSVSFADGAINATVRLLGGWQRVCGVDREEFYKWLRRDFVAIYAAIIRGGASEDQRRYLPGRLELQNGRWIGRELPDGRTYRGETVRLIESPDYRPALAAPEPKRIAAAKRAGIGFTPRRIESA